MKPGEFWDVVVVTSIDENQRDAYELQIREKIERKELPLGIDYKVFSDRSERSCRLSPCAVLWWWDGGSSGGAYRIVLGA